jgi:hypothetical protein
MNAYELADELVRTPYEPIKADCAAMLRQLADENKKLKEFVKPILAHGDDCVGDWDGGELQDLAVKSGLYIEKIMTEPCNLGREEFVGCPCREYSYGEDSWECYRIAEFLLDKEEN